MMQVKAKAIKLACGVFLLSYVLQNGALCAEVYADGDDTLPEMAYKGLGREEYEALADNVLFWDEIEKRVVYFNPLYVMYHDSAMRNINEIIDAQDEFSKNMMEQLDELEEKGLHEQASKIRSNVVSVKLSSQNIETSVDVRLGTIKIQMKQAIENLITAYERLKVNRKLVEAQISLYKRILETNSNFYSEGLSQSTDVKSAELNLANAEKNLADIDGTMHRIWETIRQQAGYQEGTEFTIEGIPKADTGFLSGRNIDEDKNYAYKASPDSRNNMKASNGSQQAEDIRSQKEENIKTSLNMKIDSMCADIRKKTALLEAADTSLRLAELSFGSAERKYSLGMIGQSEYMGLKLDALSKESEKELCEIDLVCAQIDYERFVKGQLSL